jgi:hypothetical protein
MGEAIKSVGALAGLCGHDSSNWEKVLIDASKRLVVAIDAFSAALEVTQDTPGDLLTGVHTYDGSQWRKQPPVWGFSGAVLDVDSLNPGVGGTYSLASTTVPTGEVHLYYAVAMVNVNNPITTAQWKIMSGASEYFFYQYLNIPAGYAFVAPNPTVVEAGDYIQCSFYGVQAGDLIIAYFTGFKMDLDL